MLAPAATQLVVENTQPAVRAEIGHRFAGVACAARATVADHHGQLCGHSFRSTHDAVPGSVPFPVHESLSRARHSAPFP